MEISGEEGYDLYGRNNVVQLSGCDKTWRYCECKTELQPLTQQRETSEQRRTMKCSLPGWFSWRRLLVHFLVIFFGISAWIGVNGIFIQLPLLVGTAPESWGLPAYLVVLIQTANLGPALYTLTRKIFPMLNESLWISALLIIGSVAMGLLAFFYDKTSLIAGAEHSTSLFALVFLTALVGCTSSVLFMPYLRDFKEVYLVSYFIGEGLSGVLPSAVALVQGVGGNPRCSHNPNGTVTSYVPPPRFPPRDYFLFLFGVLVLSLSAFWLLQYLPAVRLEKVAPNLQRFARLNKPLGAKQSITEDVVDVGGLENGCIYTDLEATNEKPAKDESVIGETPAEGLSRLSKGYYFALMGVLCLLGNGILPGIQSYSCLPYGSEAYHLTVTLSHMANPTACVLALFTPPLNLKATNGLCFLSLVAGGYVAFLALMSPTPPLRHSQFGVVLVVVAWILLMGLVSYSKLTITRAFHSDPNPKALFYIGVAMQMGSACGAIVSFALVNLTSLFVAYEPCSGS